MRRQLCLGVRSVLYALLRLCNFGEEGYDSVAFRRLFLPYYLTAGKSCFSS